MKTGTTQSVDCRITDIRDVSNIFNGVEQAYCIVERASEIKVQIDESYSPIITHAENEIMEEYWNKAKSDSNLHDAEVLYYLRHETIGEKVVIKAFWGPYRYFYCTLNHPILELNCTPLAVSGICLDKRGYALTAKRKNVTEYSNKNELVPSGGMSASSKSINSIDFRKQLLEELFEEASIEDQNVSRVKEIGIVRDLSNQVVDICCKITYIGDTKFIPKTSDEYSSFSWKDISKIHGQRLIPTSRGIIDILVNRRSA